LNPTFLQPNNPVPIDMPSLLFKPLDQSGYAASLSEAMARGASSLHLRPDNEFAQTLAETLRDASPEAKITVGDEAGTAQYEVLCVGDANYVSAALMDYVDVDAVDVLAPVTEHHWNKRPLFLISIPKSGTHLLYALAEAFGYAAGVICPEIPKPGCWYCVEHSNSHTVARDFFIDGVRRAPYGNRAHPFMQNPALFIYRNPMDILVSEANYYHHETSSPFHSYLSQLSYEERLEVLIDDPWLLDSIRDRVGGFIPWLNINNVASLSFEELVGAKGGGNDLEQQRLIWSLQLKLHVPGTPEEYGERIFDPDSPTFHEGKIGAHLERISQKTRKKFKALPQDFMATFGFAKEGDALPAHAKTFRHRPLVCSDETFDEVPFLLERDFIGYSLLRYAGRTYAVPEGIGKVEMGKLSGRKLKALFNAPTTEEVKRNLAANIFIGYRILSDGNGFIAAPIDRQISTTQELTDIERSSLPSAPSIDALKQGLVGALIRENITGAITPLKEPAYIRGLAGGGANLVDKRSGYCFFAYANHYYAIPEAAAPKEPAQESLPMGHPDMLVAHSYQGLRVRVALRRLRNALRIGRQIEMPPSKPN
jgi:hypothetical protein